jgi:hypothetical protein
MHLENKALIEQQISDWLREHVVVTRPGLGRCRKLIIRHMSIDNKPQGDVTNISVPQDEGLVGEIDMIVNKIVDSAQRNANDYASGVQKYALYAYYTDDQQYVPYKIFRLAAEDESGQGDLSPSEPPTTAGITSQLMRHNEAVFRTSTMTTSYQFSIFEKLLNRMSEKEERSDQQRMDMVLLMQETINEAHTRRLNERKEEMRMALQEGIFEQLKVVMPIIANRIAGKQIFPEEDKSFLLMATFLENLKPEQQAFLRDSLDPPQIAILGEILAEYEKKKEAFTTGKKSKDTSTLLSHAQVPGSMQSGFAPDMAPGSPDGPPKPMRLFAKLSERVNSDADAISEDEKLKKFEEIGMQSMSRFAGFLTPKKPGT